MFPPPKCDSKEARAWKHPCSLQAWAYSLFPIKLRTCFDCCISSKGLTNMTRVLHTSTSLTNMLQAMRLIFGPSASKLLIRILDLFRTAHILIRTEQVEPDRTSRTGQRLQSGQADFDPDIHKLSGFWSEAGFSERIGQPDGPTLTGQPDTCP